MTHPSARPSPPPALRLRRGSLRGVAALVLPLAACGGGEPPAQTSLRLTEHRVRIDFAAPLDGDSGWAESADEVGPGAAGAARPATVFADQPFRIRVELEDRGAAGSASGPAPATTAGPSHRFALQVRRNGGPWRPVLARDFPYPDEISTPRVSIVSAAAWEDGAATTDLLAGSSAPFVPGEGVSLDSLTAPWSGPGAHGEWEWPVVIRRFADGAVTNEAGDRFDFRVVDEAGRPVAAAGTAVGADGSGSVPAAAPQEDDPSNAAGVSVVLAVPDGLLGGTYVETPGRLGPYRSSTGALYFPMEPAETFNVLMMVKSVDGGRSWAEVDGANRPATGDLEGFAAARVGDTIHLLHQPEEVVHHAFRMGPDEGWLIRDEPVSTPTEPATQIAALVARSDGTLVAFYGDSVGIRMRVRSPRGAWGPESSLPRPEGLALSGVHAAVDGQDRIHVVHTAKDPRLVEAQAEADPQAAARARSTTTASAWYQTVAVDGAGRATTSDPIRIADGLGTDDEDAGAAAPVGILPDGTAVVVWRAGDGLLRSRAVSPRGGLGPVQTVTERTVVQNPSDSDQVGADLVVHDGRVHLAFADQATGDLWIVARGRDGGWGPARPLVEGITVQWIRGEVYPGRGGTPVWGIVYDAGSDGGSGMNRYVEVPLGG